MLCGTVQSSTWGFFNRIDAAFLIHVSRVREVVDELMALDDKAFKAIVASMPYVPEVFAIVRRGMSPHASKKAFNGWRSSDSRKTDLAAYCALVINRVDSRLQELEDQAAEIRDTEKSFHAALYAAGAQLVTATEKVYGACSGAAARPDDVS